LAPGPRSARRRPGSLGGLAAADAAAVARFGDGLQAAPEPPAMASISPLQQQRRFALPAGWQDHCFAPCSAGCPADSIP
ncbi:MAG: hypothetical protein ACKOPS_27195, partial [Cyanobium sp.]